MAFSDIAGRVLFPPGLSSRYKKLDAMLRFLRGSLYDDARLTPFDQEYTGGKTGQYIEIRDRRPSVVTNFAGQFVAQVVGLLWTDEQFPVVRVYDANDLTMQNRDAEASVQALVEETNLDAVLAQATLAASVGSGAIIVRALPAPDDGKPYFEVWNGFECRPIFAPGNPTRLIGLSRIYSLSGEDLKLAGYEIDKGDLHQPFWLRIDLDAKKETRYLPLREDHFSQLGERVNGVEIKWTADAVFPHSFGVVPAIWLRSPDGNTVDGECIFAKALDTIVEIDYQLSQVGRAYKYTADPMLAITRGQLAMNTYDPEGSKPPRSESDEMGNPRRSATNVLDIPSGGKAELLEIEGGGLTAALEYVAKLREYALEAIGGMKSDAQTQKGAQSGRALEILYQALVLVVKRLRIAFGNNGLLPLVKLIMCGIRAGELQVQGIVPLDERELIFRLKWPTWLTPTGPDMLATAQAWQALAGGSAMDPIAILPRDAVTRLAATNLGYQDAESLVEEVGKQQDDDDAKAQAQQELQAKQTVQQTVQPQQPGKPGATAKKPGSV